MGFISEFLNCPELNQDKLLVVPADSHYSNQYFLGGLTNHKNLVTLTRSRSSRVFYAMPKIDNNNQKRRGHPQWYGNKFDLKDESTWLEVYEQFSRIITNNKNIDGLVFLF